MAMLGSLNGVSLPADEPVMQKPAPPEVKNSVKDTPENLKKVSQEFESFLIYYMLKEMRNTVPQNSMFHGGRAEEIFQGMMDEELAAEMSKAGGIGIAPMLYQQLSRYVQPQGTESQQTQMPVSLPVMPELDMNLNDE